jgi:hypothetical protein
LAAAAAGPGAARLPGEVARFVASPAARDRGPSPEAGRFADPSATGSAAPSGSRRVAAARDRDGRSPGSAGDDELRSPDPAGDRDGRRPGLAGDDGVRASGSAGDDEARASDSAGDPDFGRDRAGRSPDVADHVGSPDLADDVDGRASDFGRDRAGRSPDLAGDDDDLPSDLAGGDEVRAPESAGGGAFSSLAPAGLAPSRGSGAPSLGTAGVARRRSPGDFVRARERGRTAFPAGGGGGTGATAGLAAGASRGGGSSIGGGVGRSPERSSSGVSRAPSTKIAFVRFSATRSAARPAGGAAGAAGFASFAGPWKPTATLGCFAAASPGAAGFFAAPW